MSAKRKIELVGWTLFFLVLAVFLLVRSISAQEEIGPVEKAALEGPQVYIRLSDKEADFSQWANEQALTGKHQLPHYAVLTADGEIIHKITGVKLVEKEGFRMRTGIWAGNAIFGVYSAGGEVEDGFRVFKLVPLQHYNQYAKDTGKMAVHVSFSLNGEPFKSLEEGEVPCPSNVPDP